MNGFDRDCSKLLEDGGTIREIALARCNCLMDRYLRWNNTNWWRSHLVQYAALGFTAITPVILLVPWGQVKILGIIGDVKFLGAAASALAAIATGSLAIAGWKEHHLRHGYTWHALQTEKYRYLTHATEEYADSDEEKAARHFASRIEQLVMAEVTDWRAEMQRLEQGSTR